MEPEVPADDDPAARSKDVLALELAVVLLVTWLPVFLASREPGAADASPDGSLAYLAWYVGWIALAAYLGWRRGFLAFRRPARALLADVARGAGIAALLLVLGLGYALLSRDTDRPVPSPTPGLDFAQLSCLVVAAAAEETLWRGYAFGAMRALGARGPVVVLATSVLFASYHPYAPVDVVFVLGVGVLMGSLRAMGVSLFALSVGHLLNNVALFTLG